MSTATDLQILKDITFKESRLTVLSDVVDIIVQRNIFRIYNSGSYGDSVASIKCFGEK